MVRCTAVNVLANILDSVTINRGEEFPRKTGGNADYNKNQPGDVGLPGICSGMGDIDHPEAMRQLLEVIKGLEKTRDSGVPYPPGDVVVDAILRHAYPEDVGTVLRMRQAWQNEGHKNPRTYSTLDRAMGENEVYARLESATLREKTA